jgi:hypothetical protein
MYGGGCGCAGGTRRPRPTAAPRCCPPGRGTADSDPRMRVRADQASVFRSHWLTGTRCYKRPHVCGLRADWRSWSPIDLMANPISHRGIGMGRLILHSADRPCLWASARSGLVVQNRSSDDA